MPPRCRRSVTSAGSGVGASRRTNRRRLTALQTMFRPNLALARQCIRLAEMNARQGRRPFASLIVRQNGIIVATGINCAPAEEDDPNAHAEVIALKSARGRVVSEAFASLVLYSSCEPCVRCSLALGEYHFAAIWYCATRDSARRYGFDDGVPSGTGRPLLRGVRRDLVLPDEGLVPFMVWRRVSHQGSGGAAGAGMRGDSPITPTR